MLSDLEIMMGNQAVNVLVDLNAHPEPIEHERVISAAVLTATTFRMRSPDDLISALRILCAAVKDMEGTHSVN